MADPVYPLQNYVEENLEELFERISIAPNEDGKAGNFDAYIEDVLFSASVDRDIYHKLDRIPVGYIPLSSDEFMRLKLVSSDEDKITLQCDVDATVKLLII